MTNKNTVKKAKHCFIYALVSVHDGDWIKVSKKTAIDLIVKREFTVDLVDGDAYLDYPTD